MGYTQPPAAIPEPHHRQWRDAAEDDATVPAEAMAVIGVYARYLASEGGPLVSVSWPEIRHLTHLSTSAISTAHKYLEGHGWLLRQPTPQGGDKRRAYYLPEIGKPGEGRKFRGQASPGRSVPRNDVAPSGGAVSLRPTEQSNHSVPRSDTLRPTERTASDHSVGRSPTIEDLEEKIDRSIYLEPGSVAELLAQIGVTEDAVATEVEALLREDLHANVPAGLLYRMIKKGQGPELIEDARKRIANRDRPGRPAPLPDSADRRPSAAPVADALRRIPEPEPEPAVLQAASEPPQQREPEKGPPCDYPDCRARGEDIKDDGYHEACGLRAAIHARAKANPQPGKASPKPQAKAS